MLVQRGFLMKFAGAFASATATTFAAKLVTEMHWSLDIVVTISAICTPIAVRLSPAWGPPLEWVASDS